MNIGEYWFMQGGALLHRTHSAFEAIIIEFGTRVIAYQYPNSYPGILHWPPYSSNMYLYLWGHKKDLVCKKKPTHLICLKIFIVNAFVSIKKETLEFAADKFVTRGRGGLLITSEGYYFESLVH
ncbi:uncharacterized protein CDAR_61871 [Caerostris darwini]|uniref:Uncharacterized protein n=1 Tax=Caerostris darwini TaxID=1538125 RepID=A0AAV4VJ92_9ARAC|nr:uncharacterized protein CDAR_61871 [Caerostris darwini]